MPNLVKIGKTSQAGVEKRMKQLYTTGVPLPFECEYACTVNNSDDVEKRLHRGLQKYRLTESREFFEIEAEDVIELLGLVAIDNVTPDFVKALDATSTPEEKSSVDKIKKKRPKLNFFDMGIPEGSILNYFKGEYQVTVCSENKVLYQGEERSLTSVTKELMGIERNPAPAPRWFYKGRRLKEIYDEYHGQ